MKSNFWEYFKRPVPTVLQLAVDELEQAQKDKLAQSKLREYHAAMEDMLVRRIARLRQEIYEITQEQGA